MDITGRDEIVETNNNTGSNCNEYEVIWLNWND